MLPFFVLKLSIKRGVEISGESLKRVDDIDETHFQLVIRLMKEKMGAVYQEPFVSKDIKQ